MRESRSGVSLQARGDCFGGMQPINAAFLPAGSRFVLASRNCAEPVSRLVVGETVYSHEEDKTVVHGVQAVSECRMTLADYGLLTVAGLGHTLAVKASGFVEGQECGFCCFFSPPLPPPQSPIR